MTDDRQVLINLVGSLSLADHMGDAFSDSLKALALVGIEVPKDSEARYDWEELATWLAENHNAETVWGTSLKSEPDEGETQ